MIVLVTKEASLRKNSNPKTKGLNPDLSLELEIASIVVPIISINNALHMAKLAKVVVGKIICYKVQIKRPEPYRYGKQKVV